MTGTLPADDILRTAAGFSATAFVAAAMPVSSPFLISRSIDAVALQRDAPFELPQEQSVRSASDQVGHPVLRPGWPRRALAPRSSLVLCCIGTRGIFSASERHKTMSPTARNVCTHAVASRRPHRLPVIDWRFRQASKVFA